ISESDDGAHGVARAVRNSATLPPTLRHVPARDAGSGRTSFCPTKAPIDCGPLQLLDPRLFPDALPLRNLARNMGFELIGGRAAGQRTQIEDLFGDTLASEQLLHCFIHLVHDRGRRAGRKGEPVPPRDIVAGPAGFGEGGRVWGWVSAR